MSQSPLFSEWDLFKQGMKQWGLRLLAIAPILVMAVLTKSVLLPTLKDPEAAYYGSTKGYPAQQRAAGQPIEVDAVTLLAEEFEDALAAPGEVIAQEQIELRPAIKGVIADVYFDEGTQIEKDQLLMRLDPEEHEHRVEIARLNLSTAEANLVAVKSSGTSSLERLQDDVAVAQTQLTSAQERLNRMEKSVLSQQAIDVEALGVQLANARDRWESFRTLVGEGALSQVQLQEAENTFTKLQREFLTAQQGSLSAQNAIDDSRSTVVRRRQELQQREQALARAVELEAVRLEKAELTVDNRKTLLSEAVRTLEQTEIRASTAGLLSEVNVDRGEFIHPGSSKPAMVIAQDLAFQAYVDQARLNHVQVGDRATVRLVAYAGQTFEGTVTRINPAIETEDFIPGRVGIDRQYTYSVWITIPNLELSPGLQGYAHLVNTQTTVSIPESAVVHLSGGEGMAMVVQDGKAVVRSLSLGPLKDNLRQVIGGLSPGEQVILHPNSLEPGDQVTPIESPPSDKNPA